MARPLTTVARSLLLAMALAALLVVGLRLKINNGMEALLPTDGELGRQARFFESRLGGNVLAIEITGAESVAAPFLDEQVVPDLAACEATPAMSGDPAAAATVLARIKQHLPMLVDPSTLAGLDEATLTVRLTERLRAARNYLRRPGNEIAVAVLYDEPLGLAGAIARELGDTTVAASGHQARGRYLMHADGGSILAVFSVPFAPSDRDRRLRLLTAVEGLRQAADARQLRLDYIGSYRHYADNQEALIHDIWFTLPISLLGVGLLLWTLFRNLPAILGLHLPALAALLFATVALVLRHGGAVPGMIFGFFPAMIGIAVDYGIHMTRACQDHHEHRVRLPLVIGFLTSAAAFAVLLPGGFPLLSDLGLFVIVGLGTALAVTLGLIPPLLRRRPLPRLTWTRFTDIILAASEGHPRRNLLVATAITLALVPGLWFLRPSTSLRSYDGSSAATRRSLDAFEQRWQRLGGNDFLVTSAPDLDTALRRGEEAITATAAFHPGLVQRFLPSRAEQARRLTAWNACWQGLHERLPAILATAAAQAGVRAEPFKPCLERYRVYLDPAPMLPTTWAGTPVGELLTQALGVDGLQGSEVISTLHLPRGDQLPVTLARGLDDRPGVWLASRRVLAHSLVRRVGADLRQRLFIILVVMLAVLAVLLRRPRAVAAVMATPLLALTWTFSIFGLCGIELTALHVLVAAFVAGIGIDDAVFLHRPALRRSAMAAVLMTTLTSLVGAGSLILSRHPLLAAVGVAVFTGMATCLVACLLTCPALAGGRDPAPT